MNVRQFEPSCELALELQPVVALEAERVARVLGALCPWKRSVSPSHRARTAAAGGTPIESTQYQV
jgi:hypothetical protein